jgi:Cu/Ag efflux protein CusF
MKTLFSSIALICILAFAAAAQENKESTRTDRLTAGGAVLVSITATIEAIDPAKREVTLKGPLGNTVTVKVDEQVKRLNEFKVGDHVTAEYFVAVAGELREPTAEEKASPLIVQEGAARAPQETAPAAGGLHQIKAVTTVEGIDLPTQTVTLKGPRGNYVTVRAQNPENLKKLRIGDTIVVTYTEALAVSLEKAPAAKTGG